MQTSEQNCPIFITIRQCEVHPAHLPMDAHPIRISGANFHPAAALLNQRGATIKIGPEKKCNNNDNNDGGRWKRRVGDVGGVGGKEWEGR